MLGMLPLAWYTPCLFRFQVELLGGMENPLNPYSQAWVIAQSLPKFRILFMAAMGTRWRGLGALACVLLLVVALAAETAHADANINGPYGLHAQQSQAKVSNKGCAVCRNTGNCSAAVANAFEGVFCGDLVASFTPCCCSFRNECSVTIFSESCDCFDDAEEQELLTARFYLFVTLSIVLWAFLMYDKMCNGAYKVMNSNQQMLRVANSPSAVQTLADNRIDVDAQSEDEATAEDQAESEQNALAAASATVVDVEMAEEPEAEGEWSNDTKPSAGGSNSSGSPPSPAPADSSRESDQAESMTRP